MRFAASRGKPACIYAHGTEHGNNHAAITLRDLQPGIPQGHRTSHEETHSAEHHGGTKKHQNERTRTRRTHKLPFIAGCSHFTRKKHKVSCSGFLPNTSPMQHSRSHYTATYFYVMYCFVMYCFVLYCFVM